MILKYFNYQNQYKGIGEYYKLITPNTLLEAIVECLEANKLKLDEIDIIAIESYREKAIFELINVLDKLDADAGAISDANTLNVEMLEKIPVTDELTAIYNTIKIDLQNIAKIRKYYNLCSDPK